MAKSMSDRQASSMTDDLKTSEAVQFCQALQITVHIRGTDERPVIEYKDKFTGRIVGGIELKKRIKTYRALLPKPAEKAPGEDGPDEGCDAP